MLEIVNFSKSYKEGVKAVDGINLKVEDGDLFGFIGPNGAGKTTTIKAVVGILEFTEGTIKIDGQSIKEFPIEAKAKTAYIPDNPDLYEHLTGIQYLNFIADIFGVDTKLRKTRIDEYSEIFEIREKLGDFISSYSHGMKQKLALISAFIHKPRMLVLDEPFVGLDPKASVELKKIMAQLCKEGSAIFFSTHVLEVAEKICNKIAIIKEGKLVVCGETHEVLKDQNLEELFLEVTEDE